MENLDYDSQFQKVKEDVISTFSKALNIEASGTNRQIRVNKVWIDDVKKSSDWESQREAVRKDKTWGVPVYASLDLVDRKTGKVFSSAKRIKVATLPKNTDLGSFIVDGKHYQVQNQLRRKPGIYVTEKKTGERKTEINISGRPFDIQYDDKKAKFMFIRGQSTTGIPLYPILSRLGISDSAMEKAWGPEVLASNKAGNEKDRKKHEAAVVKAAEYFTRSKHDSPDSAAKAIGDFLAETELRPDVTKETVGKAYKRATPDAIFRGSVELLKSSRGERKPDDRQALEFKKIVGMRDLVKERMIQPNGELAAKLSGFRKKIFYRLNNKKAPPSDIKKLISSNELSPLFTNFFTQSALSSTTDQTNPLNMINGMSKVTILGEGGVIDNKMVREEERGVHPSHLGFIDPVHTPDSSKIGLVANLPIGIKRQGDDLKTRVIDVRKGGARFVSPSEVKGMTIAFPDQYKNGEFVDDKVTALVKGELRLVKTKDVDAVLSSPKQVFSISSNTIPFLPSIQGVRAQMATKMLEQAIPLANREAPLVQVKAGSSTMEKEIGKGFSVRALEEGVVSSVTPNRITIKTKDGNVEQSIYNNMKLNNKAFLHADPTVEVGQKVGAGDVIADSNFTKDGVLALGTNLRTAYIPYKGLNFEDGIVITESAAEKLSSEHIHEHAVSPEKGDEYNLDSFMAWSPTSLDVRQSQLLDKSGVIRKGQIVKKGDPLWVGTRENKYDPEYIAMKKLSPSLSPRRGHMETWTKDVDGEVVDVIKTGKKVKVYVKTKEPARIGDKLTSRHAAKGIITKIIPDGESPYTAEGTPIDILLNPHGIVSRINPSQMLETAAAKMANKVGVPYVVDNFSGDDYLKKIQSELKKTKVEDKETLFDPHTKKALGDVFIGPQYILKLNKQATSQFSARSDGKYDANRSPLRGGHDGAKSLDMLTFYSMLAHGSRANLREMSTYKASQNPQFWNWLSGGRGSGLIKPPPEPTFAYRKFEAYLKGAGVNVQKRGSKMVLGPMMDDHITRLSNGEIKEPLFVRGKDLKEEKGGLMDIGITGGRNGDKWSHINLAEPIANPAFETPIKTLTGLSQAQYNALLDGKVFVDSKTGEFADEGITGGAALKKRLSLVDVDKEIKANTDDAKKAKTTTKLDAANKKLKYLHALKKLGVRPEDAYIQTKIPVLPPQFRPIIEMEDGQISNPGINTLYRDVGLVSNELKWQNSIDYLPDEVKAELRSDLYKGTKAVSGLGDPITRYPKARTPTGLISQIAGKKSPKTGFFQSKVIRRNQDLVGRGTIIPEPKLGLDEVGLPEEMSWKLFEPFVMRRLVNQSGRKPTEASKEVKERSIVAKAALEAEMSERPVLLNRAPSLHKFSIMAFKPRLTDGKAIKIPPLVVKGFSADFDGDNQIGSVLAVLPDRVYKGKPEFWKHRKINMSARFNEVVGYENQNGHLVICDLSDFPRTTEKTTRRHIDFHSVPDGIKVVAMDEKNGPVLASVSGWSFHRQRKVEIVTLGSGRQIITDDDKRAVYGVDATTLDWCRRRPSESKDQFVPIISEEPKTDLIPWKEMDLPEDLRGRLRIKAEGSFDFGYFLGAIVGDGWAAHDKGDVRNVNLASSTDEVRERWEQSSISVFDRIPVFSYEWLTDGKLGNSKGSARSTVTCAPLARFVKMAVGHGAQQKHLPPFFRSGGDEFISGLLSGLWDTDGSVSYSNAKDKSQFMFSYSSTSIRLVQEIQQLLRTLSITSTITKTKTPLGKKAWLLGVSIVDLHRSDLRIPLFHPRKKELLERFFKSKAPCDRMSYSRFRLIPLPSSLAREIRTNVDRKARWNIYISLSAAIRRQYVSKVLAKEIVDTVKTCAHPLFNKWKSIVLNEKFHFEKVKNVEITDVEEDGYDLTVPGYETFMNADGTILSNTMTVHVPILPDAVKEAEKMLPSNNLFSPGTGQIMIQPQNESALGIYQLSKDPKNRNKILSLLPAKLRKKYTGVALDKKNLGDLMKDLAEELPRDHGKIIDKLKVVGDDHTYKTGFTVGIDDLVPSIPEREGIFSKTKKSISRLDLNDSSDVAKARKIMASANKELEVALDNALGSQGNNFHLMVRSGARGNKTQLKQIMSSPFMVPDHRGDPIPLPVTRSFAQGLKFSDYWNTLYGARTVATEKQLQTAVPGGFNKEIMASVIDNVISDTDCNTKGGVKIQIGSSDLEDRYLAKDIAVNGTVIARSGSLVTTGLLNTLRSKKDFTSLEVRSPLTCKKPKGTCAKCYGLDENGQSPSIGDNIGAISGASLSEPLTQMTLRTFHSGGVSGAERGVITGYDKIDKLLTMQKIKRGKATLSLENGKIESIKSATGGTGKNVVIGKKEHFIPNELWDSSRIRVGKEKKKGDILSLGIAQPDELAELKGMLPAQEYIVDEIQKSYKEQGVNLKRRAVETVIRSVGNTTKIIDPGDSTFLPGDVAPWTVVQDYNDKSIGRKPIEEALDYQIREDLPGFKQGTVITESVKRSLELAGIDKLEVGPKPIVNVPFLKGVKRLPMLRDDWMSQMGYQNLKDAIVSGAHRLAESDIHGYAPVPAFAYGAEFGEAPGGRSKKEGVY